MEKEQIIKALYDANTEASIKEANDAWLACYQASSESDQQYLLEEYDRFGDYIKKKGEESNRKMKEIIAEFEAMKPAEPQH
ncbi:hypothetical protein [Dyadobacter fermentans]|uniref:Uncharacterized protein n=1 Tax=Dyadobacter fermentans (strain ATCC 700827 / DSM 18053 / CIP 107007 / KCTC 52180 / NS114) TaxID=471854 RepID=C6W6D4_DYAFD|nr:hypothetical protein [Dyadobacter fermentans]ACT94274.1 hypothetical protein Dfer_3059 [Dyadobacter fermentans DSM 18053]